MKYYLHDTSAFDDEKVTELYMQFGFEGVGIFYVILEKLAKQEKPVKTSVLKAQLRIGKRLEKCWNFMEEIGLIYSNNGETFNKQLLNFSENYQIKKEKTRKRVSEWRKNQEYTENVTCYVPVCNAPKVKESKVNKEESIKKSDFAISKLNDLDFPRIEYKPIWLTWIEHKKIQFNDTYKSEKSELIAFKNLLALSGNNYETAEKIVNRSIANSWKGLFPLDKNTQQSGQREKMYQ